MNSIEQPQSWSSSLSSLSGLSAESSQNMRPKSAIYARIREQIGYYFSDANLRHDKYMKKLINVIGFERPREGQASGTACISLSLFLNFNKIAALTTTEQDLVDAFASLEPDRTSPIIANGVRLIFDAEERTIGRMDPFPSNDDKNRRAAAKLEIEKRTIYVEGFDFTDCGDCIAMIRNIFARFGDVLSVRTPRFSHNKQLMGFAFVEFRTREAAERAVDRFGDTAAKAKIHQDDSDNNDNNDNEREMLRAISKLEWLDFKDRYLKLKAASIRRPDDPLPGYEDPEILRRLAQSFDLSDPSPSPPLSSVEILSSPPLAEKISDNSIGGKIDSAKNRNEIIDDAPCDVSSASLIARFDLYASSAADLDDAKTFRKNLRAFFAQIERPKLDDIAYLDISPRNSTIRFEADGSIRSHIYVRVRSSDACDALLDPKFVTDFERHFPKLKLEAVQMLSAQEATTYWEASNFKSSNSSGGGGGGDRSDKSRKKSSKRL